MFLSMRKMNQKDKELFSKLNDKIDGIDKNLDLIKKEIKEIPKQDKSEKKFKSHILLSLGLVLVTISITLLLQVVSPSEAYALVMFIVYFFFGLSLIILSEKLHK